MRWPLFVREVPARCVLLVETDRPAHLYLNGARLLHAWTGRRTLDLSASLSRGPNLLAIEWPPLPAPAVAPSSASSGPGASGAAPAVSYEWLVAG